MILCESAKRLQSCAAYESQRLVALQIAGQCKLHEACMRAKPHLHTNLNSQIAELCLLLAWQGSHTIEIRFGEHSIQRCAPPAIIFMHKIFDGTSLFD